MQRAGQNYIFISLAGNAASTDDLFAKLKVQVPRLLRGERSIFFDSPHKEWWPECSPQCSFSAEALVCLRWGPFREFVKHDLESAVSGAYKIIIVRQFGFDLYIGALRGERHDPRALAVHKMLVPHGISALGLLPPLYVFTEALEPRVVLAKSAYFSDPNQAYTDIDPSLSTAKKLEKIVGIIRNKGQHSESVAA